MVHQHQLTGEIQALLLVSRTKAAADHAGHSPQLDQLKVLTKSDTELSTPSLNNN